MNKLTKFRFFSDNYEKKYHSERDWLLFIILGQAIKYLLHILYTRRFFFVLVYM